MNDKGYPTLENAEKIWREGFDYRCATTEFKVRDEYVFHTAGVAATAQKIAAHTPDMNPKKPISSDFCMITAKNTTNARAADFMPAPVLKSLMPWVTPLRPKFA